MNPSVFEGKDGHTYIVIDTGLLVPYTIDLTTKGPHNWDMCIDWTTNTPNESLRDWAIDYVSANSGRSLSREEQEYLHRSS